MTLTELSKNYYAQAHMLRLRIARLERARLGTGSSVERICLDERIKTLETMRQEAKDLADLTERYYDRGYRRNAKYTV